MAKKKPKKAKSKSRKGAKLPVGKCGQTAAGMTYCNIPNVGNRFIGKGAAMPAMLGDDLGYDFDELTSLADLQAAIAALGAGRKYRPRVSTPMAPNECRRTSAGRKYCYKPGVGTRFVRG